MERATRPLPSKYDLVQTQEVEPCTTVSQHTCSRRLSGGGATDLQLGQVDNVVVTVAAAAFVVPRVGDVVAQVVQVHLEGKEAEEEMTGKTERGSNSSADMRRDMSNQQTNKHQL